jgi:hypothetical protein
MRPSPGVENNQGDRRRGEDRGEMRCSLSLSCASAAFEPGVGFNVG